MKKRGLSDVLRPRFLFGQGDLLPPYVGASMTHAEESSTLALIRPGLWPAHLPPQGKAIGKPCMAYVENYRSKTPNVA